jgi:hypothetical protein
VSAYGESKPNARLAHSLADSFATACTGELRSSQLLRALANFDSPLVKEADLGRGNYNTATEQVRIITRLND